MNAKRIRNTLLPMHARKVMGLEVMLMTKSIKSLAYFILLIFAFLICASASIAQQEYINPIDAHKFIGMEKTVCGTVASATYALRSKGRPTFLNPGECRAEGWMQPGHPIKSGRFA